MRTIVIPSAASKPTSTTAAALVLIHLIVYFSGTLKRDASPAGPPAACLLRGC